MQLADIERLALGSEQFFGRPGFRFNMISTRKKYTVEDYELLTEGEPFQLIDGELVLSPSPNSSHQFVSANIFSALRDFVRSKNLGKVLYAPFDVHLSESDVYQPDILFVSSGHLDRIQSKGVIGAPDLVVEVLSPSTGYYDMTHKKKIYAASGVKEYWIVDPGDQTVEVFVGQYQEFSLSSIVKCGSRLTSVILPGFVIEVDEIFEE